MSIKLHYRAVIQGNVAIRPYLGIEKLCTALLFKRNSDYGETTI